MFHETVYYYDRFGKEIQTIAEHQMGGTVRHSTKYNFENKKINTQTLFSTPGPYTVTRAYTYNAAGDPATVTHQINTGTVVTLASSSYNQLKELTGKSHPGAEANLSYTYNIRGWMKRINSPSGTDPLFGMELFYESGATANLGNGNITRMDWKGQDNVSRRYDYSYDPAGRITAAAYTVPSVTAQNSRYSLSGITYDPNGNITAMQRRNQRTSSTYDIVDNLAYTYDTYGNRLLQVADSYTSTSYTAKDFKERGSTSYSYDGNGNLKANGDKQIDSIVYNHLNLPKQVYFTGSTGKIHYGYDAEGKKLRQKVYTGNNLSSTTDYIGEFVFNNGQMDYLIHEEGRAVYESGIFQYEYNIRDHLGNVRQVVRAPEGDGFMATMEISAAQEEEVQFEQLPESRQGGAEHNVTPGGDRVAWLNAGRGRILGPARTQEVQKGDSIRISVHGKYEDENKEKPNAGTFVGSGAKTKLVSDLTEFSDATMRSGGPNAITVFNIIDLLVKDLQQKEAPEAYMMYALYDSDSVLYKTARQVLTKNAANFHEELEEELYISEDGYMEAFLVNETQEDVWFDDFSIQSTSPFIVQETHYDPWGLELTGLGFQAGGVKVNRYLYNGKENQPDHNLNMYDYGPRMYDPVIGRWGAVDPLASHFTDWSPYAAFNNNPINLVDPDGRAAVPPGKTYDDVTGELIHDDKIDDKKVYTGTKTDGSDRKLVGFEGSGPGQIKDHTEKFNNQLEGTDKFFSKKAQDFKNKFHSDVVTGIVFVDKVLFFKKNVTDKGPYDIKVPGKGFSMGEVGEYSFYDGKLFRYDDYGNFNYGRAASAFGYGEKAALLGAGLNQTGKALNSWNYAKENWYPISNFSNLGDDPRDSHMIKAGFNHVR